MTRFFIHFSLVLLVACTSEKNTDANHFRMNEDSLATEEIPMPIFGYRFSVVGDFNGNGMKDTLSEHYISQIDMNETDKFYSNISDYGILVDTTINKKPFSFVSCNDDQIDTLFITDREQQFGLSYLKNEGDLNGDGTDEISYVVNWADWSNMNTWHIMTFRNSRWEEIYSFTIWDWQLPNLPETSNEYGLIGLVNKQIVKSSDENYDQEVREFNAFEGLVRKVALNKIEIIYSNEEAMMDTMIVDLSSIAQKKNN